MKKEFRRLSIFAVILLSGTIPLASLRAARIGFVNNNIWLSKESPLAGEQVKIYSVVVNSSDDNISGSIRFYDNNTSVGGPQAFYLEAGGTSKVLAALWTATEGNHQFKADISNVISTNASGVKTAVAGDAVSQTETIYVDADPDGDGIANREEAVRGTNPNDADTDDDGENDNVDPAPTNGNLTTGPDSDGDGVSDKVDLDRDNDGLTNDEEIRLGTDLLVADTDNDGVNDKEDYYPLDGNRWKQEVPKKVEAPKAAEVFLKKNNDVVPEETIFSPGDVVTSRQEVLGKKIFSDDLLSSSTASSSEETSTIGGELGDVPAEPALDEVGGNAAKSQSRLGFISSSKLISFFKILALGTLLAGVVFHRLSRRSPGAKRSETDVEID